MNNTKHTQSLMIAYILFLFVSCFIYIFQLKNNRKLDAWERIVVAVTISSYFFSFSSMFNVIWSHNHASIEFFEDNIKNTKEYIKRIDRIIDIESEQKMLDALLEVKTDNKRFIDNNKKTCKKLSAVNYWMEKLGNIIEIAGFFAFFLIAIYDNLFSISPTFLSGITVLAFATMIGTNWVSNYYGCRLATLRENNNTNHQLLLSKLDNLYYKTDIKNASELIGVVEQ